MDVDELFDAWERAWSGRDPRGFESSGVASVPLRGPADARAAARRRARWPRHARKLWEAFPDARVNSTGERLCDGTFACAPCRLLGTHTGDARADRADRPLRRRARGRLRRARGRAAAARPGVLRRLRRRRCTLGVLPKPGTAGERALLMLRGFGLALALDVDARRSCPGARCTRYFTVPAFVDRPVVNVWPLPNSGDLKSAARVRDRVVVDRVVVLPADRVADVRRRLVGVELDVGHLDHDCSRSGRLRRTRMPESASPPPQAASTGRRGARGGRLRDPRRG